MASILPRQDGESRARRIGHSDSEDSLRWSAGVASVIGEIFDAAYPEAASEVQHHLQTILVSAGGAMAVELTYQRPGAHVLADDNLSRMIKGAVGTAEEFAAIEGRPLCMG
jgi:hypothetical protein